MNFAQGGGGRRRVDINSDKVGSPNAASCCFQSLIMAETKTITLAQCQEHMSDKDCWLVIDGKVYDVTPFLDEHPGGFDTLVSNSGAPTRLHSHQPPFESRPRAPEDRCGGCQSCRGLSGAACWYWKAGGAAGRGNHDMVRRCRRRSSTTPPGAALSRCHLLTCPALQARTPRRISRRLDTAGQPRRCWASTTLASLR